MISRDEQKRSCLLFQPSGQDTQIFPRRRRRRRSFIHIYFFSLFLFHRIIRIYVYTRFLFFEQHERKKPTFSSSSCFFAREEFPKKSTLIPDNGGIPIQVSRERGKKSISLRQAVFQMEELFRRDTIVVKQRLINPRIIRYCSDLSRIFLKFPRILFIFF